MKDPAPIFIKPFESHLWIRPEGRGTFIESPIIKSFIESSMGDEVSNFVIDLEACPGMDSTFMGMLAGLGIGFRKNKKGKISIVGTTQKTRASLKELGLQHLISIEPNEGPWIGKMDEARADLKPIEAKNEGDKEGHVLECHEDLCVADEANLERFKTVLDMLGSDITSDVSSTSRN